MNRRLRNFMVAALIIIVSGFAASREEAEAKTLFGDYLKDKGVEVEVSATIDFYDKYVWRGFLLDNDNVLQPGITIAAAGFEGGFWGSWDLEAQDGLDSDEVDGWIGYNFDLGFINESLSKVGVSVGNTWYAFPETSGYTKELYLGLSLDTFLQPSFTWYHDYGEEEHVGADGNFYMLGINHSLDLVKDYGITLDLSEELGFNDAAFIVGNGGYYLTKIGISVPLSDLVTMSPSIGYSVPFGDLKADADGAQREEFFGGVSLAYSF